MCLLFKLLKGKFVNLPHDAQEKLDILRCSGSSVEKEYSHEELMDLNEVNDLIIGIFPSVTMFDMAEYWKDFLSMYFLSIPANHCTMLPWLTVYDNNRYSRWLPYFWSLFTNLPMDRERFLEENYAHSLTEIIGVTMNKGSKLKSGWLSIL